MQSAGKHFTVTLKSLSVVAFSTTRGQKTIRVKQKKDPTTLRKREEKRRKKKRTLLFGDPLTTLKLQLKTPESENG